MISVLRTFTSYLSVLFLIFLNFCDSTSPEEFEKLIPIENYQLDIPEPSDLSISSDGESFWIVSDESHILYNVSKTGDILRSFSVNGDDLEGVCAINNMLFVVDESTNEVICLNNSGIETERYATGYSSEPPYALEGITYNSSNEHFYLVNEKNPVSIIEYDTKFNFISEKIVDYLNDISGITYDSVTNSYWITSDESRAIVNLNNNFEIINRYEISISQVEGIYYDPVVDVLYVVSDKKETLYQFQL